MNTSDLLEQLLRASQGPAAQTGSGGAAQDGLGGLLGGLLGGGRSSAGGGGGLGGLLGGLLGGSAMPGQSPGGGQSRSSGPSYAVLASLGMMAFKAYQSWQQQQASAPQAAPRTVDQLSGAKAEQHSHAILRALIAAAKADGRIDAQEEALIGKEIGEHSDDPDLQQWLDDEVGKPLDADEVASAAEGDPAIASEMYLASVLLIDHEQGAEREWLDQLASALGLEPQLQISLEAQVGRRAV